MQPCRSAFLISLACPLAVFLLGCSSINLETTTLSNPAGDNSSGAVQTFHVSGRQLMDPCGYPVVLRGVNEMFTYISSNYWLRALGEIAKTQANSVRIYWHTTDSASDLDQVLSDAESVQLIPVIYVFNYEPLDSSGTPTLVSDAVKYWTRSDVLPVIKQHEHWLIIALREKGDTQEKPTDWIKTYTQAVTDMRSASINVPLAIDAPNEGSDVQTLLTSGRQLNIADSPRFNLLLNVNSGVSGDIADNLAGQLRTAAANSTEPPLLVGEISWKTHNPDNSCGDIYDYTQVLTAAQETQTGWLAWSWGYPHATNINCPDLDMTTNGTYAGLTQDWGQGVVQTDPNSIQNTSQPPHYLPGGSCN